jgi:pimeloyl-ACP methyl ester carboxylesterase
LVHSLEALERRGPALSLVATRTIRPRILRRLLNALLYLPSREILQTPAAAGLDFADLHITTPDGERLHAWWVPTTGPTLGHVLLLHGNAGNIGDRVPHIALLAAAGFDVLAFDPRGYGRSTGRPSEQGTYRDARAALAALERQEGVDPQRVLYLGESLGGAVALELAIHRPPAALVLQSAFTDIRDMARLHYPFIPRALVPDAYPSLRRIRHLDAPLLVLHGARDTIVPLMHGEELFHAAPEPKHLEIFPHAAHNDLISRAGRRWVEAIVRWFEARR